MTALSLSPARAQSLCTFCSQPTAKITNFSFHKYLSHGKMMCKATLNQTTNKHLKNNPQKQQWSMKGGGEGKRKDTMKLASVLV